MGNRIVALMCNIAIVFPSAMPFWRHHMRHHSHIGIEGEDNDLAMDFEINWVGTSRLRKLFWLVFYVVFATMARGFVRKPNKWETINVGLQVIDVALILYFIGPIGLLYLGVSTFFGYSLIHPTAAHFIHEHYTWKKGQETYSYYGPLNWVTCYVGYHNEHHDLMGIPGRKLRQVRETAPEFYEKLTTHRSWSWVLWHFVMEPSLGHHSRIVRTNNERLAGHRLSGYANYDQT